MSAGNKVYVRKSEMYKIIKSRHLKFELHKIEVLDRVICGFSLRKVLSLAIMI